MIARELLRGGQPVRVFERSATLGMKHWNRIATRVVTVLGKTQMTGALVVFEHRLADEGLATIERVRKRTRAEALRPARSLSRVANDRKSPLLQGRGPRRIGIHA